MLGAESKDVKGQEAIDLLDLVERDLKKHIESKSQKSNDIHHVSDQRELLIKYQNWYWKEVQGKPYQTTANEIVDSFNE